MLPEIIIQKIDPLSCKYVNTNEKFQVTSQNQISAHGTFVGLNTFELIQNSTTLNVTLGSTVSGIIPVCISLAAPMKFYLGDPNVGAIYGCGQCSQIFKEPKVPGGITVSMRSKENNNEPHPLILAQLVRYTLNGTPYSFVDLGKAQLPERGTLIPTTIGHMPIPFTISVSSKISPGTYHLDIFCFSFLLNNAFKNISALDQAGFSFSNATEGFLSNINTGDVTFAEAKVYVVTLHVV
jgi:hypothetical protein